MLFLGSWKMDPNCIDIGPYSPSASYAQCVSVHNWGALINMAVFGDHGTYG